VIVNRFSRGALYRCFCLRQREIPPRKKAHGALFSHGGPYEAERFGIGRCHNAVAALDPGHPSREHGLTL
jgi:hypothetical protein